MWDEAGASVNECWRRLVPWGWKRAPRGRIVGLESRLSQTGRVHGTPDTEPMLESDISEHVRLVRADGDQDSATAVVAFGGIMQGLGAPEFEFFNTFNRLRMSAMFVRDPRQSWYSRPIPGLGDTTDEIARSLRRLTDEHFPGRKIVTVGNSMGAFAAMLFGVRCDFHSALCFAPQTFISRELRAVHNDARWSEQIDALAAVDYADVRPLLLGKPNFKTDIFIGAKDRLDGVHAKHLKDLENVTIHRFTNLFNRPGHSVANWLSKRGRLGSLLHTHLQRVG